MDVMFVILEHTLALRQKGGSGWKHFIIRNRRGVWWNKFSWASKQNCQTHDSMLKQRCYDGNNWTYCKKLLSCTRLRIPNTICRKPGFNSLRTPLNHGAEQASNETLKQTQQRNWSNASQGGQTALKENFAVLHYETASTTQQPRGEHRDAIKDCKIAGATTWQGQGNHTFITLFVGNPWLSWHNS